MVIDLFSGLLLPISFFPLWAQEIMKFFPFQAISYIPSMIFTDGFTEVKFTMRIMFQLVWVVLFYCTYSSTYGCLLERQLIVQGG